MSVWNVGRFRGEQLLCFAQNIIRSLRFQLVGEKFGHLPGKSKENCQWRVKRKNKKHIATFILNIIKSVGLSVPK